MYFRTASVAAIAFTILAVVSPAQSASPPGKDLVGKLMSRGNIAKDSLKALLAKVRGGKMSPNIGKAKGLEAIKGFQEQAKKLIKLNPKSATKQLTKLKGLDKKFTKKFTELIHKIAKKKH
ncbi:hypothetical protein K493DRAFT_316282 [Basidiobolus meristosporus CBS 931.73]|uniref:Uncharacterized protein n=1 Tax=Basidiobolus meristosporus CBS 931.73 TaxID=1314790 RepID=A0A1Y1Y4K3_9FUNG|nr:hypothetical protein K493DRAFT_316282 [Basidiobolus meristosporus CBS 931.73]|eukprot:ORX92952.1 hypothetical protein K493DRAFT_316282 [Basidiobolus meristosporus CBS 931.73]